jgi:polyisoprenoid-binding protein YceI
VRAWLVLCLAALAACNGAQPTQEAAGNWALDGASSSLHFLSTKNGQITETHRFTKLEGGINEDGRASLVVNLASVQTGIDIRNSRMQQMLFEVADFPLATARIALPPNFIAQLPPGGSQALETKLELELHGQTQTIPTQLRVARLADNRLQVSSEAPVLLAAADFGLLQGVQALREVAGLDAINPTVPVTVLLQYAR